MQYILISLLVASVTADRLENIYLPPNNARTSGGSGSFLESPVKTAPAAPSHLYDAPSSRSTGPTAAPIAILRLNNENNGDGKYNYDFETENHITQQESGQQRNEESFVAQGSYSFQAPDGQIYTVNYVADENGFQAQGAHIPTSPPVPEEIVKALAQNAADEAAGITDDGQYRPDPSEGFAGRKYLAPKTNSNNGGYNY